MRKVSNKMLAVIVINIIWFTVAAIILQFCKDTELSSTLITCWFAFWGTEIVALTAIKVSKVRNPEEEDDEDEQIDK